MVTGWLFSPTDPRRADEVPSRKTSNTVAPETANNRLPPSISSNPLTGMSDTVANRFIPGTLRSRSFPLRGPCSMVDRNRLNITEQAAFLVSSRYAGLTNSLKSAMFTRL